MSPGSPPLSGPEARSAGPPAETIDELVASAAAGQRSALARLLSLIERGDAAARRIDAWSVTRAGGVYTIGVTGAPGAGKSTLVAALVDAVRASGERVAVLAIDPSSPFSGGAILGDRIRMRRHALDGGVFIRSMASRGQPGGLAQATPEAVRLLGAAGYPWVVVETVGVGQIELDIAGRADTVVVVVNPGWGDAVQASKAGLLEIADVFAINKADRPGATQTRRELETALRMSGREIPIVDTVATDGTGAGELWEAILAHRRRIDASGELVRRRAERAAGELRAAVQRRLAERAAQLVATRRGRELSARVVDGSVDPWTAAAELTGDAPPSGG